MASGKSWKLLGNSQLCIHLCVMNGPLVTARLRIRELRVDDAYNILLLNSDPEVLTYVHDVPFADLEAARQWIADVPRKLPNGIGRWSIFLHDGTWIGRCSLRKGNDGTVLMGYRILRTHWGKGYATETVGALLALAFNTHSLPFVLSAIARDNAASRRVLEKNGARFWKEGTAGNFAQALLYRIDRPTI